MAKAEKRESLTELELCALGVVWLRGPCSAYVVRKEFAESTSSHWSSTSGSVYPVMRRLLRAGMIAAKAEAGDGRGKRNIVATNKGARALRGWVNDLSPAASQASLDPVRTRMNFLGILKTSAARHAFIRHAQKNTKSQIAIVKRVMKERNAPLIERLATIGCVYELEGRLRWLADVSKALKKKPRAV